MRLRDFSLRCSIANAACGLLGLALAAAVVVGVLAYTAEPTGRTAALLAITLIWGFVAAVHGIARLRRRGSAGDPAPRPAERFHEEFLPPTVSPPFVAAREPAIAPQPRRSPSPPGGAMLDPSGRSQSARPVPFWGPGSVAGGAPLAAVWLHRLDADLRSMLENEVETRRMLAREVYGVPEEWLEEVMRVRMSDVES